MCIRTRRPRIVLLLAGLFLTLSTTVTYAAETTPAVEVIHLANEGFMIEGAGHKILIDALYGEGFPEDPVIPLPLRTKLEVGEPPFDGIDLLLATHRHADHFDAGAVGRFLTASPHTRLLTTPQAVADLKADFPGYDAVASRVEAIYPPEGKPETRTYDGFTVTVHNLHHGRRRDPPVENLGFVIDLAGVSILHAGDTEMDGDEFAAWEVGAEIDAALFPIWYFHAERVPWIQRHVAPRTLVPIHFPSEGADARVERVRGILPDAPILLEPFDKITVRPAG